MRQLTAIVFVAISVPQLVFSHSGGLDSLGCHHDRKRGGYHCHRGPLAGQSFSSKEEAERELQKQKQSTEQKPAPKSSSTPTKIERGSAVRYEA